MIQSSTSAANGYPPAELVTPPSYNNEFSKRHSIPAEEFRHSGEPSDRERRRSSKDSDHRPSSRNNKSPKHDTKVLNSLEKVTPRDKERDNRDRDKPEKPLSIDRTCAEDGESTGKETVKPSKRGGYQNNYFKPLGMRNNLSSGNGGKEVQTKATTNHSTNREQDDLVAMGTLWKSTPGNKTNGNIGRSFSIGSNNGPSQSLSNGYTGGTLTSQRRFSNKFGQQPRQQKDTEPRYPDPLSGASASFQQRLAELAALESETIRWERTRKLKKRSKQETSS
ncbi:uncharacterized protein LOC141900023 [Tubulanus polymorphus]|uniref:uncharacterized protein LOC141900023 n=1 Tax=Tubulanus polymorphus TaxID=672921 RepID=UPI003DA370D3